MDHLFSCTCESHFKLPEIKLEKEYHLKNDGSNAGLYFNRMKLVLQASGTWEWVSGEQPAPTDPADYARWKRIDAWVLYRLQSSIDDECFLWSESTEGFTSAQCGTGSRSTI